MTTEIEKTFFDTFGIEPKTNREYGYTMAIYNEACTEEIKFYPQISDRILLELICFIEQIDLGRYCEYEYFCKFNYEDLRTEILAKSIRLARKKAHSEVNGQLFYNQVRTLFEEG